MNSALQSCEQQRPLSAEPEILRESRRQRALWLTSCFYACCWTRPVWTCCIGTGPHRDTWMNGQRSKVTAATQNTGNSTIPTLTVIHFIQMSKNDEFLKMFWTDVVVNFNLEKWAKAIYFLLFIYIGLFLIISIFFYFFRSISNCLYLFLGISICFYLYICISISFDFVMSFYFFRCIYLYDNFFH